jgi:SPX domain protein involved in polyphosphate accumulation
MQTNRREFKYIIDEPTAVAIRQFIKRYLVPDEYARPELQGAYWIHSLYLDNHQLSLANATLNGLKNRFKLRVRFYDETPTHPVFFEIKSRVNDVILKERAAVHRACVPRLLKSGWPERSDLVKYDAKNFTSLQRFCSLRTKLGASGQTIVSYQREAYVAEEDDNVRLTFDRSLLASPFRGELRVQPLDFHFQPQIDGVVLEMKFTDRYPHWMRDLTWSFNLNRGAMAKYVHCVQSVHRYALATR